MTYFRIVETDINVNPFEQVTVNAMRWVVGSMPRGTEMAVANCTLMYIDSQYEITDNLYFYDVSIPKTVIDTWLDDSVIDDHIIESSNGLFIKL